MKHVRYWVQSFFGFSRKESDGFFVLSGLMIIFLSAPFFLPDYGGYSTSQQIEDAEQLDVWLLQMTEASQSDKKGKRRLQIPKELFAFDPNTATVEEFGKLGLPKYLAERIEKYRSKGGKFRKKEDVKKIYGFPQELYAEWMPYISIPKLPKEGRGKSTNTDEVQPIELADFDPNTASISELERLGIHKSMAERIAKYRAKGGQFRKKEDLKRIYDFPEELYALLEEHITIEQAAVDTLSKWKDGTQPIEPFEINTATADQLRQISGIGEGRAGSIIKYRDRLGGFHSGNQLGEVYALPPEVSAELLKYISIDPTAIRPIDVNTATLDRLRLHPYISYTMAKLIVSYREEHGFYSSVDDISQIKPIKASALDKVRLYLVTL